MTRTNALVSRTRAQGASLVNTLPEEGLRRLGITAGQELQWIEDGLGGYRLVPYTAVLQDAMAAHEAIMAEYDSVFRELAK